MKPGSSSYIRTVKALREAAKKMRDTKQKQQEEGSSVKQSFMSPRQNMEKNTANSDKKGKKDSTKFVVDFFRDLNDIREEMVKDGK